jgi:hypothetical protein
VKITRFLVLVLLFGFTCSVALADGTDPVFKLGGGGSSDVLTSDTFAFSVNPNQEFSCNGTDVCVSLDFINFTGATIVKLNLLAPAGFTYSCDNTIDPYFTHCTPPTATPGPTTISFFGLDGTHLGIQTAHSISGECDNDNDDDGDDTCTADNGSLSDFNLTIDLGVKGAITQAFTVHGTLVPAAEPGTLVLVFAAGLGLLALKRSGFTI